MGQVGQDLLPGSQLGTGSVPLMPDPFDKGKPLPKWMFPGIIGANLFDAESTRQALKSGASEQNPVMSPFARNPAALYAMKVGMGGLIGYGADKVSRMGHPKLAKAIAIAGMAGPSIAGMMNTRLAMSNNARR